MALCESTKTSRRALLGAGASATGLGLAGPHVGLAAAPRRPIPKDFMRGMTVSCPGYGRIWGSGAMREAMQQLTGLGVGWTAVHPYAGVRTDGSIRQTAAQDTGYLPKCAKLAKAAGHQLFWKPHLAYWGSFEWRGAITFEHKAAWKRFFSDYRRFIVDQATFADKHQLPLFCVGIEYQKTLSYAAEWRDIIKEVRRVYRGPITYAANWDEASKVPFWKQLDLIGVQAYFPLLDQPKPTVTQLVKAWDRPMDHLKSLSKDNGGRPLLFTEIGYARSMLAAKSPWKPEIDNSAPAVELRTRLFAAAFARMAAEPLVRGAFWWKWIPGKSLWDGDFSMKDPEALAALRQHWGKKA